jgi:NADH-quinone oxidoreductase subunit H
MVVAAFLITILFLGGWHFWGITGGGDVDITWTTAILRVLVLMAKILLVIVFFMLVRWSWPRFRFDQLMALAWKVMLPLGLLNFIAVAVIVELGWLGTVDADGIVHSHPGKVALAALAGWGVMVLGWVGAAIIAPLHTDNRPRQATQFDLDRQLT